MLPIIKPNLHHQYDNVKSFKDTIKAKKLFLSKIYAVFI